MKRILKKRLFNNIFMLSFVLVSSLLAELAEKNTLTPTTQTCKNMEQTNQTFVKKFILKNGMTVLIRSVRTLPLVSIQLWYGVGSKDEGDSERGIAHLIEHMIFKGTEKLSESDINVITHQLSGSCNAFTSYDYTGYLFDLPTQNWHEALPIMADCMVNVKFDNEMLSSEMKAVIQELKMHRDQHDRNMMQELISTIFAEHPYHHPIIGYKQDLWNATPELLRNFYKKHYVPNNATLIIVGDIDENEALEHVKKNFELIKPNIEYKQNQYHFNQDLISKSVTLYRDIKQPVAAFAFVVPGAKQKKDYAFQVLGWILAKGKSSRLYKRLVEELRIATDVEIGYDDLFDYGLLVIVCEPIKADCIDQIKHEISLVLDDIAAGNIHKEELIKGIKQSQMSLYDLMEDVNHQAYEIGKYFLATGDENFAFTFLQQPAETLKNDIIKLTKTYLRPILMNQGLVLPLPPADKDLWKKTQELSDQQDEQILAARIRTMPVEPARHALTIKPNQPAAFNFPKPTTDILDNGIKVFTYCNTNTPKITIIVDLKVDENYDSAKQQGLCFFASKMLTEGTKKHTAQQLAQMLEERGIAVSVSMGRLSMDILNEDFSFALDMIYEMLTESSFNSEQIEKVREQLLAQIKNFWDNPQAGSMQLIKQKIYQQHPYGQNSIGTTKSIKNITREDLIEFYKKYMSPSGARICVVGDIKPTYARSVIQEKFGNWQGPTVESVTYPPITKVKAEQLDCYMNRDQVSLVIAQLSINRTNPDFDKLLLFDQIIGGGVLRSMNSRLFELREQTGLFYTIGGSLLVNSRKEPGLFTVKTIVSIDRLQEAQDAIIKTVKEAIAHITEQELQEAKQAIINTLVTNFETNDKIANTFLFLDFYNLPITFFDNRAAQLSKITVDEVLQAVRKVVKPEEFVILRVGRVGTPQEEKSEC